MPVPTTRKRHGRHYTPPELARFLARRGAAHLPPAKRLRILDPACGDGELLLAAAAAAAERGHEVGELAGLDLDADGVGQARRRLAATTTAGRTAARNSLVSPRS